jgi:D-alanine-D-alanine ligase
MKVTVLLGGPSSERPVSLVSGAAVANGLREAGHTVFESDIAPDNLTGLDHPADVVFPVLHGFFGESGELQEILEARKIPFVGSGSKASRAGMNKVTTKQIWEKAGLPTPPYAIGKPGNTKPSLLSSACVVKAISAGSSIDVHVFKTDAAAQAGATDAYDDILSRHREVLVEKFIQGPELTVGLLEETALAPIRIVPKVEFFDYSAKYQRDDTEHRFDTGLPSDIVAKCRQLAEQANAAVGARDLARIDIMLDERSDFHPYLLEINTLPGFTPKSLLPEAAAHGGTPFASLVDRLVRRAANRVCSLD